VPALHAVISEKYSCPHEKEVGDDLTNALERDYTTWKMTFGPLLRHFASWLEEALTLRLKSVSALQKEAFLQPVRDVQRQYLGVLQAFRDRLSDRAMQLFGVPLRTTETDIVPQSPASPDINIGYIFDHNWELLSPIIPMTVIRGAVKTRFLQRVRYETFKNLSRLTTQWTDIVAETIIVMQREAERRLELLIETIEHLTAASITRVPDIQSDLDRVRQAQESIKTRRIYD
jgi:hypothetical protein